MELEPVNWSRISRAVEFYQGLGFKYIDTPWFVDQEVGMITCPSEKFMVRTNKERQNKNRRVIPQTLVGSAEQGFLQMALEGLLTSVNYVSAGPCFREEPVYDELHLPQFFKVELFVRCNDQADGRFAASELLYRAKRFMEDQTAMKINVVEEGHGWDLELNGIEIGSYGYRYAEGIGYWAYGTGLAEPRFSQALVATTTSD